MSQQLVSAAAIQLSMELFDRGDERFVSALRQVFHAPQLAAFVDRWKQDPRPWAREQVLAYLQQPLNVPGHHVVVKRLFKAAEARHDHRQMAAFLVAFDRLTHRIRRARYTYNWNAETGSTIQEVQYLANARNVLAPIPAGAFEPREILNPFTGKKTIIPPRRIVLVPRMRLFSYRTRRYLQRRAWRYFRKLGFYRSAEYVPAIGPALLLYRDEDLAKPENLLDSWGLMHACFGSHPALDFDARAVRLKPGHTMAELTAAGYFEPLWAQGEAGEVLWKLLVQAPARTVRVWARQMLERLHSEMLQNLSLERLLELLGHNDTELQQMGALLLATLPAVERWPVDDWLRLLNLRNPTALAIVCEQLQKRLTGDRLDLPQTLALATARATPVARIGLQFLRGRKWDLPDDRRQLARLGDARCEAVAEELAQFVLGIAGPAERYERDVAVAMFDSLLEPMRSAAYSWFTGSMVAQDDPVLWSRLIETPFDELRLRIIESLQERAARPRIGACDLAPLWSSVLLGVHRGGRQKLKAVEQLVAAVVDRPEDAPHLMPVLIAAVRSIRGPEQRAGLAGVARLVDRRPELAGLVRRLLPELSFD